MKRTLILGLLTAVCAGALMSAQIDMQTSRGGGEALRLLRRNKLDLILPGAMRDNKIDMWIHVTRQGDPDPLAAQFGSTYGYLVFTDVGKKIERAAFGGAGAVEDIDVRGSDAFARAMSSYGEGYRQAFGFGEETYDEFRQFVEKRDPKTIAIDTSDWLAEADGLSHSSYTKLVKILGPKYATRTVSSEKMVSDFIARRTLNEIAAQANALEPGYRLHQEALARIVPGRTTIREITSWATEGRTSGIWQALARSRQAESECITRPLRNRHRILRLSGTGFGTAITPCSAETSSTSTSAWTTSASARIRRPMPTSSEKVKRRLLKASNTRSTWPWPLNGSCAIT